jgi:hypothetical protein
MSNWPKRAWFWPPGESPDERLANNTLAPPAAIYGGHALANGVNADYASTVWAAMGGGGALTLIDEKQLGITRAGNDFTFAAAGTYNVDGTFNWTSTGPTLVVAFRLRDVAGAITKAGGTFGNTSGGTTGLGVLKGVFDVLAGQVLQLQYCAQIAANFPFPAAGVDAETLRVAQLTIARAG